ncbi:MAG: LPS export ABC transporter permease LptG [Candidatus Eisenbacteria bacterium]
MRILDGYLLRRALKPLGLVFAAFVGIFILVDLFDHAHTFIDNSVQLGIVLSYYLHYLPLIVVLTMPVAMLLAVLLSVGGLARRREIMAIKGGGISLPRMLAPHFLLAFFLSLVSMAVAEFVLPQATSTRLEIEEEHIKKSPGQVTRNNIIYVRPDGAVFLARRLNTRRETVEGVTVEEFDADVRPVLRIDAEFGRWDGERWQLENGLAREFTDGTERTRQFDTYELPYSEPTPDDLKRRRLQPEEMGYRELRAYIQRLSASGHSPEDLPVNLHLKIAFPFVTLIMTMLGAPIAAGARRTGFALSFTSALAISFLYYGLLQVGQVLGRQGVLTPALAAWVANIVFAGVGVWLLARAPK